MKTCGDAGGRTLSGKPCRKWASSGLRCRHHPLGLLDVLAEQAQVESRPTKAAIKACAMCLAEAKIDKALSRIEEGQGLLVFVRAEIVDNAHSVLPAPNDRTDQATNRWRHAVLKRDGYRCVRCGEREKLQVHHIEAWADNANRRLDMENAETLCIQCHAQQHPGQRNLILASPLYVNGVVG